MDLRAAEIVVRQFDSLDRCLLCRRRSGSADKSGKSADYRDRVLAREALRHVVSSNGKLPAGIATEPAQND
jgi:hypothetical protein